ncbi:hypothetical protein [Propionicimonas sp.]|uniref:hypothetical protein n=1 Tax=Propionicimonas sp. TaxID=1955623 RepID=UPI0039E6FF06
MGADRATRHSPDKFSWYFWVPIVGPLIGGVIGVLIYDWFIGNVLNARARLAEGPEVGRLPENNAPGAAADE